MKLKHYVILAVILVFALGFSVIAGFLLAYTIADSHPDAAAPDCPACPVIECTPCPHTAAADCPPCPVAEGTPCPDSPESQDSQPTAGTKARPAVEGKGPGMFLVGVDIQPGTYRIEGSSMYQWQRLSCLDGSYTCIIEWDFLGDGGQTYVSVLDTDKALNLSMSSCTFTKIED